MVLLYAWQKVIEVFNKRSSPKHFATTLPLYCKLIQQRDVQITPSKHGIKSIIISLDVANMENNE